MKTRAMKKQDLFWAVHLTLAVFFFLLFYAFSKSGLLLGSILKPLLLKLRLFENSGNTVFTLFYYGRDFSWGYAVVFSLLYIFRGSKKSLERGLRIASGFEVILLLLKLFIFTAGAMDAGTVIAVILGNALALLTVLAFERILL